MKRKSLLVVLMLVFCFVVSAVALFTFYAKVSSNVTITPTFQICHNQTGVWNSYVNAEGYTVTDDVNGLGGFSKQWNFKMKYSASGTGTKTVHFNITDFEVDGVDVQVLFNGAPVTSKTFAVGEELTFTYKLVVSPYTVSNSYLCKLEMKA